MSFCGVPRAGAESVRGNGAYGEDEVGHVAVAGDDLEAADGVGVADDIRDAARAVLLHRGGSRPRATLAMALVVTTAKRPYCSQGRNQEV